jgi:hypothetical protein
MFVRRLFTVSWRYSLQAQGTPGHRHAYTGALDVIRKTYKNEGIGGFYKGLAPTLVKVSPIAHHRYGSYGKPQLMNLSSEWGLRNIFTPVQNYDNATVPILALL